MKKQATQLADFLNYADVVKLDPTGVFKYILIDIIDNRTQEKITFVRGESNEVPRAASFILTTSRSFCGA